MVLKMWGEIRVELVKCFLRFCALIDNVGLGIDLLELINVNLRGGGPIRPREFRGLGIRQLGEAPGGRQKR